MLAFAALIAGCYSPSDLRCKYRCGANNACPGSLECNPAINMCGSSAEDTCDGVTSDADVPGDVTPDVVTIRDATSCDFPAVANVDPCQPELVETTMTTTPWVVTATENVDTTMQSGGPAPWHTVMVGTRTVSVVVVASLTIDPNSTLNISGNNPLIILVRGDVQIKGRIVVLPVQNAGCTGAGNNGSGGNGGDITANNGGGGGAGGGAFGGEGGNGVTGWQDGVVAPPMPSTTVAGPPGIGGAHASLALFADLDPLRPGCPGGRGGFSGPAADRGQGGLPGKAGGAIQISAKGSITFEASGAIYAYGGGGGQSSGFNSSAINRSGGGGGGSGGAILLEAREVSVMNASLCTNGGGGGGYGAPGMPSDPLDVQALVPDCSVQLGGSGIKNDFSDMFDTLGANGGDADTKKGSTPAATPAQSDTPGRGGGGGGGSVGVVRINADTIFGTTQATVGAYSSGVFSQ